MLPFVLVFGFGFVKFVIEIYCVSKNDDKGIFRNIKWALRMPLMATLYIVYLSSINLNSEQK